MYVKNGKNEIHFLNNKSSLTELKLWGKVKRPNY